LKETPKKATVTKAPVKTAEVKAAPAKKIAAKKAAPTPIALVAAAPAHEQISQRAYEIWAKRGFSHGNHSQDWTQAEQELKRA
jgi:Protein of unknown function (DUF2934)